LIPRAATYVRSDLQVLGRTRDEALNKSPKDLQIIDRTLNAMEPAYHSQKLYSKVTMDQAKSGKSRV
jgi:hypothetical protein